MKERNPVEMLAALARIAAYDSPNKLRKDAKKRCGLYYAEALEMSYENAINEARAALGLKQR